MNPVFVFLVVFGAIIVWFMMSGMFKVIGNLFGDIFDNTKRAINDQETNEEAFVRGIKTSMKRKDDCE